MSNQLTVLPAAKICHRLLRCIFLRVSPVIRFQQLKNEASKYWISYDEDIVAEH
ncbi:10310_t:CDS:2 [Paraglomus brasilianum]|uniref:10310_t:CDS:1 n=1 Tax=Paraglomus brasilianum TaxID=144538 RepID=A0A9N8ZI26_9GLOM|nr:10310_t:CDS:2 [Paraglomus brasilianum]